MPENSCTEDVCRRMSVAQLLGPLRPNASICVHGHRFTLDELFPRNVDTTEQEPAHSGEGQA